MGELQSRKLCDYLTATGVQPGMDILVHSSFHNVRNAFPGICIKDVIHALCVTIGLDGSVIMPAFTYCFRKKDGVTGTFDRRNTPSQVGAVPEVFRLWPDTKRTSSPTHSFSLWGQINQYISPQNNPVSPLGRGSVLDWLHEREDAAIVMLGTSFNALSFGHYIEISIPVPWADISPWSHLSIEPVGVSVDGDTLLKELPGCSKSFINFEKWLVQNKYINKQEYQGLESFVIPVRLLFELGTRYFREFPDTLLCPQGSCAACDERWVSYLSGLTRSRG